MKRTTWVVKSFLLVLFVLITSLTTSLAYGLSLSTMGALTLAQPSASSDVGNTFSPELGLGGGLLFEVPISNKFRFELGALYVTRVFSDTIAGATSVDEFQYFEVPLQLRFWIGNVLSFGLGGYYALGVGPVIQKAGRTSVTLSYSDYGIKAQDFGVMGSIGLNIPLGSKVSIYAQGQYLFGLANTLANPLTDSSSFKDQDIQILLGLRFGGQISK